MTNQHLERIGADARIDHRSHADRGILEQPTIHEGVTARAMEQQGMIADRCELNRQIKADNRAIVDRSNVVVFCIQHESGGAWQTMKYAKKQGKSYININDDPMEEAE